MARSRFLAPIMVLLVLFFSGCTGSSAAGPKSTGAGTSVVEATGEPVPDAGTIAGTVTDDALMPLKDAQVGIIDGNLTATSDANGQFAFKNLAPGTYKLVAQKLGYSSGGKSVELPANAEAKVQFVLSPLAVADAAFIDLVPFKLFMACGYGLIGVTVTTSGALCPEQVFGKAVATHDVNATRKVLTAIGEMKWTQTSGFSAKTMRLDMGKDESGGSTPSFKYKYDSKTGVSPVRLRAEAPLDGLSNLKNDTPVKVRYRIWVPFSSPDPPFVMLVLQQSLDVYSSFFYGEAAPETYTALPDQ